MGQPVADAVTDVWDTSCADWIERIKNGASLLPANLPLIEAEATRAVAIFNRLRLPDVPGTPTLEEACGDWSRDMVRVLFGSYDPVADVRHIREIFAMVPKKSAKTTLGAAIMLTAVLMSRRPRAEFLLVAPRLEAADIAFRQLVGMIECDPVLTAKFHIQEHIKKISYRTSGAFLKVKSFDPKIVTGVKPAGVLLDEVHVIAEHKDADRVIGQLRGGLISQPEGFMAMITTQSEREPSGVFKAELSKARAVRDGVLRAPMLPLLYEFPKDVDWRNPANWHMVTPNNGRSITVERLIPDYEEAVHKGEGELRRWASQHLNLEIGLALRNDRWAGADFWEDAGDKKLTLAEVIRRSDVIETGVDGGGLDDLLGLTVLGRDAITGEYLHWVHCWAHPIVLERRKEIAARLLDFVKDGDLTIVEKIGDDVREVVARIEMLERLGKLDKVGLDPAGIGAIVDALEEIGITVESKRIVGVSQGWRMTGAIKTTERLVAEKRLIHGASPMMAWCVGNARVEPRGNAITITKQASGSAKIDPLCSTFNAVTLMAEAPASVNLGEGYELMTV